MGPLVLPAWLFGAARVLVVDHLDYRLEFASRFARCEAINFRHVGDVALHLKKLTGGLGPDVAIDAVGAEAAGSALQRLLGVWLKLQSGAGGVGRDPAQRGVHPPRPAGGGGRGPAGAGAGMAAPAGAAAAGAGLAMLAA